MHGQDPLNDPFDPETGEVALRPSLPAVQRETRNLIFSSPECAEVFGALCEAQGAMENPKKTKTAKVKGKTRAGAEYDYTYSYAPLEAILDAIKKPFADAGLVHRQFLAQSNGMWMMRTIVAHRSGQWYGCDYPIFWDESRGMQGFASGVTYARRYGLMMASGLVGEDDDDANLADGNDAKIASAPRAAQESRPAPRGTTRPEMLASVPQNAANGSAEAELKQRHRELAAIIADEQSIPSLNDIPKMPAWATYRKMCVEHKGEGFAAETMRLLEDRIERRRQSLDAGQDYEV